MSGKSSSFSIFHFSFLIFHFSFCSVAYSQFEIPLSPSLQSLSPAAVADWGIGCVQAHGTSERIEARPAIVASLEARQRAVAALAAGIPAIAIDADRSLGDLMAKEPALSERLAATLRRAEIIAEWFEDAGNVTAAATLPIFGSPPSLLSVLYPRLESELGSSSFPLSQGTIAPAEEPSAAREKVAVGVPEEKQALVSGEKATLAVPKEKEEEKPLVRREKVAVLAIDARRVDLTPALLPRVRRPDGEPIQFPSLRLGSVQDHLPFWYVRTYEQARKWIHKGERMVQATAVDRAGRLGCDPVLAEEDMKRLEGPARADFARVARIVILY